MNKIYNLIIIDFETTGFNIKTNGIIQIGAYSYYYDKYFNQLLNPEINKYENNIFWNKKSEKVNKITKKMIVDKPLTREYLLEFVKEMIFDNELKIKLIPIFIAHNSSFDKRFFEKYINKKDINSILNKINETTKTYKIDIDNIIYNINKNNINSEIKNIEIKWFDTLKYFRKHNKFTTYKLKDIFDNIKNKNIITLTKNTNNNQFHDALFDVKILKYLIEYYNITKKYIIEFE